MSGMRGEHFATIAPKILVPQATRRHWPNFDRSYPGAGVPNIPPDTLPQSPPVHRPAGRHRFNVSAFATTLTDDSAIAAPANTGLSKPRAANGIPSAL